MPNTRHPPSPKGVVTASADALGETSIGLSGSEIGRILAQLGFDDPGPEMTKRYRLAIAPINQQRKDNASNCVIRFLDEDFLAFVEEQVRARQQEQDATIREIVNTDWSDRP